MERAAAKCVGPAPVRSPPHISILRARQIPPSIAHCHRDGPNGTLHTLSDSNAHLAALTGLLSFLGPAAQAAVAAVAPITYQPGSYTPSPMEIPSWEIWAGFVAGVVPFVIASFEFGKRILIQQRCTECNGR